MIASAVVCPHPPVLLRELCGAADTVAELRAACRRTLEGALASRPDVVVVVGGAAESGSWDPSLPIGVRRFGTTRSRAASYLPQSLGVARRLLDEAGWTGPVQMHAVAWDADRGAVSTLSRTLAVVDGRALLLVMADGSARRGERAPGHLDDRAFAFDDRVGRALDEGDGEVLAALDAGLAADLLVQGRAALAVLGEVVVSGGPVGGVRVTYRDDPFGVMYTVAAWDLGCGEKASRPSLETSSST